MRIDNNLKETTISFVRHGRVHNPRGVIYGRLPNFRLSREGMNDAERAGLQLSSSPLEAVYASPLLRTRQ